MSDLSEGGDCTEKHVEIVRYRVLNLRLLETHGTAEVLEPRFECLENEKTTHFANLHVLNRWKAVFGRFSVGNKFILRKNGNFLHSNGSSKKLSHVFCF